MDEVLEWSNYRAYFESEFQTAWRRTSAGFQLTVDAHRIQHEELDEQEWEDGASDITIETWVRVTYDVVDGVFRRAAHERRSRHAMDEQQ